jgi:mersacidin/lichenicidin family type 2 lantibiotic
MFSASRAGTSLTNHLAHLGQFRQKEKESLMSRTDIVRAWKDEEYFDRLSAFERSQLPQNPAGIIEISDDDLLQAEGGTTFSITMGCNSLALCPYTLGCTATITFSQEQILG